MGCREWAQSVQAPGESGVRVHLSHPRGGCIAVAQGLRVHSSQLGGGGVCAHVCAHVCTYMCCVGLPARGSYACLCVHACIMWVPACTCRCVVCTCGPCHVCLCTCMFVAHPPMCLRVHVYLTACIHVHMCTPVWLVHLFARVCASMHMCVGHTYVYLHVWSVHLPGHPCACRSRMPACTRHGLCTCGTWCRCWHMRVWVTCDCACALHVPACTRSPPRRPGGCSLVAPEPRPHQLTQRRRLLRGQLAEAANYWHLDPPACLARACPCLNPCVPGTGFPRSTNPDPSDP